MVRILARFLVNALAIWLTAQLLPSMIQVNGAGGAAIAVIMFGLVNALVRPLVTCLTLPLFFLTLGLFTFVLNGLMFWLASVIASVFFPGQFLVEDFWAAFLGAIVMSIISMVLSVLIPDEE
jgi:putative membrane protein